MKPVHWYTLEELRGWGITFLGKGEGIDVALSAHLDCGHGRGPLIQLGDQITITMGCHLLTHDAAGARFDGVGTQGKVIIEDHVFIGVHSILLPGTCVRSGSIIAAGSVLFSGTEVPSGEVWGGNPARKLGDVTAYLEKRKQGVGFVTSSKENLPVGKTRLTGTPELKPHYVESLKRVGG